METNTRDEFLLQRWHALREGVETAPSANDWQMRFQLLGFTHALVERGLMTDAQFEALQQHLAPTATSLIKSTRESDADPLQGTGAHLREVWNGLRLTLALVSQPRTLLFHLAGFSEVLRTDGIIDETEFAAVCQRAKSHWTREVH
ncbi:hypothetical protein [Noviherbaspirillum galbum]|uniref:Uncharacterized protein n=1 Tax=Noviherbaspirillum galbum TaxID=2709383 RepID=A0A6B3SFX2_9BURK|nr:hypothetical protein [Noviherbaspirillum galbum]NEX59483.1 hypothetical protein [Noviherbaspirillum galbum]